MTRPRLSQSGAGARWFWLWLLLVLLVVAAVANLGTGLYPVTPSDIHGALLAYDESSPAQAAIVEYRMPRVLAALGVGLAFGMAGALVQTLAGNPVAAPDILGVNAGAVLAVVVASSFLGLSATGQLIWFAFLGATVAGALVYTLGMLGRLGAAQARLVLAGAALTALFSAGSLTILLLSQETFEQMRFWLAGTTAGARLSSLQAVLPYLGAGVLLALMLGNAAAALALGEEAAKGVGQNVNRVRLVIALAVILLSGSAVAVVGPIAFVGLVAPHMARFAVGGDPRWVIPIGGLVGALMLVLTDMLARSLLPPREIPVGIITALIGAPVFIYLVRKKVA